MHNIVLFGEAGVGKSSIINMLMGKEVAKATNDGQACTLQNESYELNIDDAAFRIHDTTGLSDSESVRVPSKGAVVQLFKLLRKLDDGVSLLVYCMRAPRIREAAKHNWNLFYDIICRRKVAIVMVITGLENEENMNGWMEKSDNWDTFKQYGMQPLDYACITATRGKQKGGQYTYQEEYDESVEKVKRLILKHYMPTPWKVGRVKWLKELYESQGFLWCKTEVLVGVALVEAKRFVKECGMTEADAEKLAKDFEDID
jgi:tRNA U34 5-carboxymethylaminomethyl modifying GTPase MnmE/TrmE